MLRCRLQFALPMSFKIRVKSITIANLVLSFMVPRDYLHPYTIGLINLVVYFPMQKIHANKIKPYAYSNMYSKVHDLDN